MKAKILSILGYVLSVGFNIPHLVSVYVMAGNTELPELYNWLTLVVIDFGILVLALNNKDREATVFALVIFLLNLYFYWGAIPFPDSYPELVSAIPGLLYSAIPAFFVLYFSELIAEQFNGLLESDSDKIEMLRVEIDSLSVTIEKNRKVIETYRPAFESLMAQKGSKVNVSGVKGMVHDCGVLVVAGSNKEKSCVCSCGELIKW